MRARWNGPGSLSTTSGAARPGSEFDSEQISEANLAELVASRRVTLLEQPPRPAVVPVPKPVVATPAVDALDNIRQAIVPPAPAAPEPAEVVPEQPAPPAPAKTGKRKVKR